MKQAMLMMMTIGKLSKLIFGKSWEFGPRRGGGLTQSQLLQITVFMAYLTPFLPKVSEKFTEKIPTFVSQQLYI